jgi:hypothetical protein
VGLALMLCNLWAELHDTVFSEGPLGERRLRLSAARVAALIAAMAAAIAETFGGYVSEWQAQRPLPQKFAAFQTE